MTEIEAVYQDGVFKPLQSDVRAWLEEVRRFHEKFIIAEHGYLPDSTPDIAKDRLRDI